MNAVLDCCEAPMVMTTGLLAPSPAGSTHVITVWFCECTGQLMELTVTVAALVPNDVPTSVSRLPPTVGDEAGSALTMVGFAVQKNDKRTITNDET